MAYVKCSVCGKQFDRTKEPFVKTSSTRYAHKNCGEALIETREREKKDKDDRKKLEDYVKEIYKIDKLSPLMKKQIEKYLTEGMTYSGMLGTLYFFYGIQHHDTSKAQGIGIIPYAYQNAADYFNNLSRIKLENEGNDYTIKKTVIKIPVPQSKPNRRGNRFKNFFEGDD